MTRTHIRYVLAVAAVIVAVPCRAQTPMRTINGGLPSVAPDGHRIAFISNRAGGPGDVYVIHTDGSGEVRLTNTPQPEDMPRWLPGGRILVSSFGADSTRAFTINADGTDPRPFLTVEGRELVPSPDGKRVLFQAGKMQMQGGRMSPLLLTLAAPDGSARRPLSDTTSMVFNTVWSPDGTRIAYARMELATRKMHVGVMNGDGTGAQLLAALTDEDGSPQWPTWSPDGKLIAVQAGKYDRANRANSTAHIWLIDVASRKATKLAPHDVPYLDETPSFFPDGKRIAFQSDRTGRMEVWVMNVDGTAPRQITR